MKKLMLFLMIGGLLSLAGCEGGCCKGSCSTKNQQQEQTESQAPAKKDDKTTNAKNVETNKKELA